MEGCFGIASPTAPLDPATGLPKVNLDLDNELESSLWFTRDEILAVLDGSARSSLTRQEVEKIDKATQKAGGHGSGDEAEQQKDPGSIANTTKGGVPEGFKVSAMWSEKVVSVADHFRPFSSYRSHRQQQSPTSSSPPGRERRPCCPCLAAARVPYRALRLLRSSRRTCR